VPHHKATAKRLRQDKVRRVRNRSTKARIRTETKKIAATATAGKPEETEKSFRHACSVIDKAAKRNIIPKNRASRKKSRLAKALKNITPAS